MECTPAGQSTSAAHDKLPIVPHSQLVRLSRPLSSPGEPKQTLTQCTVHTNALAYSLPQIALFIIVHNHTVHLH